MVWTQFMDMHSGGSQKASHSKILIEAPEDEARVIFFNRFGHNPERVSCTCCGEDYSINQYDTAEQATAFDRGCEYSDEKKCWVEEPATRLRFNRYRTMDEYRASGQALFIHEGDIKPEERAGEVPVQGYVWRD